MGFESILGHPLPKRILAAAIARGRLAHAYLFHGPEGVGKRTLALALAQALLCRERPGQGCDRCPTCRRILHESHPDVLLIRCEPEKESVGVDQVRSLLEGSALRPFEQERKVFILDQVHLLTGAAANALLKTLEEPPDGTLLVLVADRIAGIPPTVVSRCQLVAFQGVAQGEVRRFLVERESLEEEEADWLAAFCEGSIGRALRYVREDWGAVRLELIRRIPSPGGWGLEGADYLRATCRPKGVSAAEARARARTVLHLLTLVVRDVVVLASGGGPGDLYNRDRHQQLLAAGRKLGFDRAMRVLQTATEAIEWTERNAHVELLLETFSLRVRRILAECPEKG